MPVIPALIALLFCMGTMWKCRLIKLPSGSYNLLRKPRKEPKRRGETLKNNLILSNFSGMETLEDKDILRWLGLLYQKRE